MLGSMLLIVGLCRAVCQLLRCAACGSLVRACLCLVQREGEIAVRVSCHGRGWCLDSM